MENNNMMQDSIIRGSMMHTSVRFNLSVTKSELDKATMVAVQEYRIVLPFTVEEYKIAQLYMVAKYSASESSGDDGDGVEVLKNEPFEDHHRAGKLPSWLVSLVPKKALMLEEEAWNAYPQCTTVLKCPFFNKFQLILETTHLPDCGTTENALNLDSKMIKKRQVEFIDIAMDPVETYVEDEDPTKFTSQKTGRGPLEEGWQKTCSPVMCAYKCVTVDVPYWGFGARLEKFVSKNAQRKILLEGHRKCFCWLDEWHGLTMEDVRKMENDTAQAISRARAMALRKVTRQESSPQDLQSREKVIDHEPSVEDIDKAVASSIMMTSKSKDTSSGSPRLMRRPSLVGPSVALGITTLSASDVEDDVLVLASTAPPLPSPEWKSGSFALRKSTLTDLETKSTLSHGGASCESFASVQSTNDLTSANWESVSSNGLDDESDVANCVAVLDRAIAWAKARTQKSGSQGTRASGIVTPVAALTSSAEGKEESGMKEDQKNGQKGVSDYVTVIDKAMSAVRRRPGKPM